MSNIDQASSATVRNQNEYIELAQFYDLLMQAGYYDYQAFVNSLALILGIRTKILDVGIGTGLLTEQMLQVQDYDITGVDFSEEMLVKARRRLSDYNVKLLNLDIRDYPENESFQSIISSGGAICISHQDNKQYRLYSYCDDKLDHIRLLGKLYNLLEDSGLLIISIQGEHKDYSKAISSDITYSQEINHSGDYMTKWYTFSKEEEILARQSVKLVVFDEIEMINSFTEVGFKSLGVDQSNRFYVFQK